jgi:hypothetical protein
MSSQEEIKQLINELSTEVSELKKQTSKNSENIAQLQQTATAAETERSKIILAQTAAEARVSALELKLAYLRAEKDKLKVIVYGIPDSTTATAEDTKQIALHVLDQHLGLSTVSVVDAERFGKIKPVLPARPRPVMIKLENEADRVSVFMAKKKLSISSGLSINKFLPKELRAHEAQMRTTKKNGATTSNHGK